MADIDSDDQDFGPAPAPRFEHAGKRSLQSMLETATDDRMSSKRTVKRLQLTCRSAATEKGIQMWHNRLLAFRRDSLGVTECVVCAFRKALRPANIIIQCRQEATYTTRYRKIHRNHRWPCEAARRRGCQHANRTESSRPYHRGVNLSLSRLQDYRSRQKETRFSNPNHGVGRKVNERSKARAALGGDTNGCENGTGSLPGRLVQRNQKLGHHPRPGAIPTATHGPGLSCRRHLV